MNLMVLKTGVITAMWVILTVWKDPSPPNSGKWIDDTMKIASYEKLLARLSDNLDIFF